MVKVEKERKFKTEYIPVYISSTILILFICLLVLTINYEGHTEDNVTHPNTNNKNEELAITKTDSSCNKDELNELINLANKVSGEYASVVKEIPIEQTEDNKEYWESISGIEQERNTEITIKGLSEGIFAEVSNDYNDDIIIIRTTDLNEQGEYKFASPNMDEKINYVVSIFSDKYSCTGEILRKVSFETKIYNFLSTRLGCTMYPNYENCAEFVDEFITPSEFMTGYEKYTKKHKEYEKQAQANLINAFGDVKITADEIDGNTIKKLSKTDEALKKLNENKELIFIAVIIIGIGVLVVVLIRFIRRHRL